VFGGDHCGNIDRIMRLPGTMNWPDKKKREKGREPALAKVINHVPENVYNLEDKFRKSDERRTTTEKSVDLNYDVSSLTVFESELDVPGWISLEERVRVATVWGVPGTPNTTGPWAEWPYQPEALFVKEEDNSRSAWLFDVVCDMVRKGFEDQTIMSILLDPEWGISESVLEKGRGAEKYAARQIVRAKEVVSQEPPPRPKGDFQVAENGKPYANRVNMQLALDRMGIRICYDEFKDIVLISGLPGFGPELSDPAVVRIKLQMAERFGINYGKDAFYDMLRDVAYDDRRHPIREFLNNLKWDGIRRIDTWLSDYGGAKNTEYVRAVGALSLIAAVRRIRKPGTKFDQMPVFEGAQGTNKSSAVSLLAMKDSWFTDSLPLCNDS